MRRLLGALWRDGRGGAAIEFAVLSPLLFTILLGIVEMGRMFYVRQALEYATEQAARYYMVNPTAVQSDVTTALQNAMPGGMGPDVVVTYPTAATTSCNSNSNASVTCTTINATYTFVSVASYLNLGNPVLKATAQAVRVQ